MRVTGGGQDRMVTEDLLYLEKINPSFDQICGIAVAQAMRRDLFFIPHDATT